MKIIIVMLISLFIFCGCSNNPKELEAKPVIPSAQLVGKTHRSTIYYFEHNNHVCYIIENPFVNNSGSGIWCDKK